MSVNWPQLIKAKQQQLPKCSNLARQVEVTGFIRVRGSFLQLYSLAHDNLVIKSFTKKHFLIGGHFYCSLQDSLCLSTDDDRPYSYWSNVLFALTTEQSKCSFVHPSSFLLRACQLCCSPLLHYYRTGLTEWGLGSRQLTQSLLPGSGS